MAWTQADLDALRAAMSRGALEVQYGTRRVRYQSLAEMLKLFAVMDAEVNPPSDVPPTHRLAAHAKGV